MILWNDGGIFYAVLPLPPLLNRKFKYGHLRVLSDDYVNYKELLPILYLKYKKILPPPIPKIHKKRKLIRNVYVQHRYFINENRRDIDSMEKVLNDALQGIFYENDIQIGAIVKSFHDDKKNPRVEVMCGQSK